jgi:Flp pilus assembly protein TadG
MPAHPFARALRRFRRGEGGYMLVEAVLIIPVMLWGYLALYAYWDAYRTMTDLQKVAYALSDLISREQRPIDAGYITGLRDSADAMMGGDNETRLRVTSIMWSELENRFVVEWSVSPSGMAALTTEAVNGADIVGRIPEMGDGRTAIIYETELDFDPALSYSYTSLPGIQPMTFREFIVTPPRYAPRVVLE